ncbi:MAG: DUF1963 domain-containing protein [Bacteroidales bacterium]|nr:DUF1963 domain-containing protein [Bacteroidales bacterium]
MIGIKTAPAGDTLFGKSKWWGFPDMPESLDFPEVPVNVDGELYYDPLTLICQIRCADLAPFDPEGLLPHEGMLYFFGAMDYFLGDMDADVAPGMGEWSPQHFKVLYAPGGEELHTHSIRYPDGTDACLPAEKMAFSVPSAGEEPYTRLLGEPYLDEVREAMPGMISLLQVDEDDRWDLRFYDSGMMNFLITPEDLSARRFDRVRCYLHSF